jgi:hypothetical protein
MESKGEESMERRGEYGEESMVHAAPSLAAASRVSVELLGVAALLVGHRTVVKHGQLREMADHKEPAGQ